MKIPKDIKELEELYPEYYADVYRKNGCLEKTVEILKKSLRKHGRWIEQVLLSYILLEKYEEAEKLVESIDFESKTVSKMRLTLELRKNVENDLFKYKCGSLEYQNILQSIIEYLLKYFDPDLINAYYVILKSGCSNSKCNCFEVGDEAIKNELLDEAYLNILGDRNIEILEKMYKKKLKKDSKVDLVSIDYNISISSVETVENANIMNPNSMATVVTPKHKPGSLRKNNKYLNAVGVRMNKNLVKDLEEIENYEELLENEEKKRKRVKIVDVLEKGEDPLYDIP
ncbi:hypothetical protein NGRA_0544 [Nosema granulosis]|uniref:Uncharacterized protein n=1 Tax=Nosema granulosis TaxID=83296 RepID=A0A9P6H1T0_9MICR|nr:hypothetical protein NGRA_0544 [Nosema granulosis]